MLTIDTFKEFHKELVELREKHQTLYVAFFKLWRRSGRPKNGFSVRLQCIDCRNLEQAREELSALKLKPNPLYDQYLVTKHRMLVEEQQLFEKYKDLKLTKDVASALALLLESGVLDNSIINSVRLNLDNRTNSIK